MLNTLLLIFCCVIIALFCWSPKETVVLEKYKVNFETEGGTAVAAIEIEEGKIPERPQDPTREGYIFVGWMLGDELYDFTTPISGDATLKAVWKEIDPDKKYYTVTIDIGDGVSTSQPVEEGEIPIAPTTPTRDGYKFMGWELNGEPYDFTTPVEGDVTITAKWEQEEEKPEEPDPNEDKEYTVKFNLNGGSGSYPDQVVKHGQRATNPGNPTRTGYNFTGWSPNINTAITKDTTFTAQWAEKPVDIPKKGVYYNLADGSDAGCAVTWVQVGSTVSPSCTPTNMPAHHSFSGQWSCSSNTMTDSGVTCVTTPVPNTFKVTCPPIDEFGADCTLHVTDNGSEISGVTVTYTYRGRDKTISAPGAIDKSYFADGSNWRVSLNGVTHSATK